MFIVLLGAPGSGKGTAGKIIAEDLKLAHISTGDLFRENLKNETELGKEAKEYMDKGELVPDEITINMFYNKNKLIVYANKVYLQEQLIKIIGD